jgi:putative Mg2+ transporter-C (MgtC) family protein
VFRIRGNAVLDTGLQVDIILRLALALGLGASIGFEREFRGYPAGIRTLALVAVGSALFSDMSRLFGGDDRIAAQVVTGIGFLGAGVIFREGASVRGITTAATIWAVAAMGVAIGAEAYLVAIFAGVVIIVLLELRPLTKSLRGKGSAGFGPSEEEEQERGHE